MHGLVYGVKLQRKNEKLYFREREREEKSIDAKEMKIRRIYMLFYAVVIRL